jgi:hypothetical protein
MAALSVFWTNLNLCLMTLLFLGSKWHKSVQTARCAYIQVICNWSSGASLAEFGISKKKESCVRYRHSCDVNISA